MAFDERDRRAAIKRLEQSASQRAYNVARHIRRLIRQNAPVQTGDLRDSYYIEKDHDSGDWLIKSSSRYWQFVEFGTGRVDPPYSDAQPHVRPAIDAAKARYGVD